MPQKNQKPVALRILDIAGFGITIGVLFVVSILLFWKQHPLGIWIVTGVLVVFLHFLFTTTQQHARQKDSQKKTRAMEQFWPFLSAQTTRAIEFVFGSKQKPKKQ